MGTHFIIQTADMSEEEVEKEKMQFKRMGFKVVILKNGYGDVRNGINELIENHIK